MTRWPEEIQANITSYQIKRKPKPTWQQYGKLNYRTITFEALLRSHEEGLLSKDHPPSQKQELLGWDWEQWESRQTGKSCSEDSPEIGILSFGPGTELELRLNETPGPLRVLVQQGGGPKSVSPPGSWLKHTQITSGHKHPQLGLLENRLRWSYELTKINKHRGERASHHWVQVNGGSPKIAHTRTIK